MPTTGGRSNKLVFLCVFVRCIIQDPNLIQTIWTASRPVLARWSRRRVPRAAPSSCGARHGLAPRLQALHLHGGTMQSLCKSKGPCFFQSALEAAEVCLGESKAGNGFQPVCRFQGCRVCPGLWQRLVLQLPASPACLSHHNSPGLSFPVAFSSIDHWEAFGK